MVFFLCLEPSNEPVVADHPSKDDAMRGCVFFLLYVWELQLETHTPRCLTRPLLKLGLSVFGMCVCNFCFVGRAVVRLSVLAVCVVFCLGHGAGKQVCNKYFASIVFVYGVFLVAASKRQTSGNGLPLEQ